jgi:mono/diheme cytochrome c family protein
MTRAALPLLALSLLLSACRDRDADLPPEYRAVAVPAERLASPAARERGRRLFAQHCALCHGVAADGRGARREGMSRPPADLTDPAWRQRTSARRAYFSIREGAPGTAMPAWRSLTPEETWDLVAYVLPAGGAGGAR